MKTSEFPADFVWGAGTAAYQIEGGVAKHGRGLSVWDVFSRQPGKTKHGHTGDVACDHVHRFAEDVSIMKRIGLGAYRFSISWPRVLPEGVGASSEPGLGFYDRLVDKLLAAGIEPWITLFHWDLPYELHKRGGWQNPDSPYWFAEYTRAVVDRLSDRVSNWLTINEPQVFIGLGYGKGEHAPGLSLPFHEQIGIAHNVLLAHGMAARTIRERSHTTPRVGWAPVGITAAPATESPEDIEAARRATFRADRPTIWSNSWFNDPVMLGRYPEDGLSAYGNALPASWERDLTVIHQPLDFFGINLYRCEVVRATPGGQPERVPLRTGFAQTAFAWEITPEVLYWAPTFFHERYRLPVLITENGMSNVDYPDVDGAVRDPQRIAYTRRHLLQLRRAVGAGVPIMGYMHWSLMDNYEWAEGYAQRFGLVHVDFETQQRTLKDSASWYARVIATRGRSLDEPPTASAAPLDAPEPATPR